jgi:hypothetical protein
MLPVGTKRDTESALAAAAAHLGIALLVQVESYFLYVRRPSEGPLAALRFLGALPFHQLESVGVAALVGLAWLGLSRLRAGRALGVGVFALVSAYVVVDQIAYHLFFDHFRPSWSQGALQHVGILAGSLLAEVSRYVVANLALTAATAFALWRHGGRPPGPAWGTARRRAAIAAAAAMLLASAAVHASSTNYNLEHHAVVTLVRDVLHLDATGRRPGDIVETRIFDPRYGELREQPEEAASLARAVESLRRPGRPPNVVLVVLESVGALQLLSERRGAARAPSAATTPNLAALEERSVVFEVVRDAFPGTTLTHIPLNLGGRLPTWRAFSAGVGHSFAGPSLVGELRRAGYRTGLFSAADLAFQDLGSFYEALGYDEVFDFGKADPAFIAANRANSWGGDEPGVLREALGWVAKQPRDQPFFLQFLTNTTHHPYEFPAARVPRSAPDEQRYRDAVHHADAIVGDVVAWLEEHGLAEDTLLVLTGDHGETFGELHVGNYGHLSFLREENIRTFLWMARLGRGPRAGARVRRPGAVGDIMPTLLAALGLPPADVPGQSLLGPDYRPRTSYFFKTMHPAMWGLADGKWKYVAEISGQRAELYDLEADPDEQRNVAAEHATQVEVYDRLCGSWYVATDTDFFARVASAERGPLAAAPPIDALRTPGLKSLHVGVLRADGSFVDRDRVHPWEHLTAWTQWIPFGSEKTVSFDWISPPPAEERHVSRVPLGPDVGVLIVPVADALPHEPGAWRLEVFLDGAQIEAGTVTVDPATLPVEPPRLAPTSIVLRTDEPGGSPTDGRRIRLVAEWPPRLPQFKGFCSWTSPDGHRRDVPTIFPGGEAQPGCLLTHATAGTWRGSFRSPTNDRELAGVDVHLE